MFFRLSSFRPQSIFFASRNAREVLGSFVTDIFRPYGKDWLLHDRGRRVVWFESSVKSVQTSCRISVPGTSLGKEVKAPPKFLRDKNMIPDSDPPSAEDVNSLYQFFDRSTKLVVLTGAGISTECGIPDYRRFISFIVLLNKLRDR